MELRELRRVYARQMLTIASASGNERLEEAFACVPREKFLGPAGWRILTPWSPLSYIRERDPALAYQDVVVALDEQQRQSVPARQMAPSRFTSRRRKSCPHRRRRRLLLGYPFRACRP